MKRCLATILLGIFLFSGCGPNPAAIRYHCENSFELEVLDKENWRKFVELIDQGDGTPKTRPYHGIDKDGQFVVAYRLLDEHSCRESDDPTLGLPVCKPGRFNKGYSLIAFGEHNSRQAYEDSDLVAQPIARFRDDYYVTEAPEPTSHRCYDAISENYGERFIESVRSENEP